MSPYTTTSAAIATIASGTCDVIQSSAMPIWRANTAPAAIAAPAQSAALAADASANAPAGIFNAPAIGGATVEKPGTNFDTTTEKKPQRSKMPSVWRTQVSGESETRHRKRSTGYPYRRPAQNQSMSATSDAAIATANALGKSICAALASAPASIIVGTAGMGNPSC